MTLGIFETTYTQVQRDLALLWDRVTANRETALQDILAKELLQEIEWEDKWDDTLENSRSALDKMTRRAMKKYREGKTIEKGFDEL